jgi:hypothetical protein
LGGIPDVAIAPGTSGFPGRAPLGFAANPANPFATGGTNREKFMDFKVERLTDVDGDGMMEYADTLPGQVQPGPGLGTWPFWGPWANSAPYLYISTYGGQGYDIPGDVVGGLLQSGKVGVSPYGAGPPVNPQPNPPGGTFIDVYRQAGQSFWAAPIPTPPYTAQWGTSGSGMSVNASPPSVPWNTSSFQIISPGADHFYGIGGEYEQGDPNGLLIGVRSAERDNITNFSSGTLAP